MKGTEMKTAPIARLVAVAFIAGGLAAVNVWGNAATAADASHDHGSHSAKPLPAGKRWATDAPLRDGMAQIRKVIEPRLPAVHGGTVDPREYGDMAARVEQQVAGIVTNCKLPSDADAALHGILAEMGEATQTMAGKTAHAPREGAVQLARALDRYGRTFTHPGWKPLRG
jgi:hypothetical protein